MITIFGDFDLFSAKKMGEFHENLCYDPQEKLTVF
jgi:hypothetical protein